jgi:hypothetical protein
VVHRQLRPHFGPHEKEQLLATLGHARTLVLLYGASQRSNSGSQPVVDAMKTAADNLAEHLTGNPRYYWQKPHAAGGGVNPSNSFDT